MSRGYNDRRFPKLDVTSSNLLARSFPRMASIHKVTLTRYADKQGNRVAKGTKGARTIKEKSSKWHSMCKEGGKLVKDPLATDRDSSLAMLTGLMRPKERERAGLVNPYKAHLDRPLSEHVADYLSALKAESVSDKHFSERSCCLLAVIQDIHAKYLPDLTAESEARLRAIVARLFVAPVPRSCLEWRTCPSSPQAVSRRVISSLNRLWM
jgi:hypothetical protein